MNTNHDPLLTPVHIKTAADAPWPANDLVFYSLAGNGLFLCRNHKFFRSCVRAPEWPSDLAEQATFLEPRYPRLPRRLFELIVGFFDRVARQHDSEAGVLLVWDAPRNRVRVLVPPQRATVSVGWSGRRYPIGLHYEVPDLAPGCVLLGSVHSHVDMSATPSATDQYDEAYRAGLHIIVGRLQEDPPDVHVTAVVDRSRFTVPTSLVLEGYEKRNTRVPPSWLAKVTVEEKDYRKSPSSWGTWTWETDRNGPGGSRP